MSSKKNKSRKKNKNSQLAKKMKKKLGKSKNNKKNKINKDKGNNSVKKSSFSYSLKKYQNLPLRDRMLQKLKSSRFRFINEQFYSMTGKEAFKYFQNDQEAFTIYHQGYQQQIQSWPKNPIDVIAKSLKELISTNKNIVIGDFGCGSATLAKSLPGIKVFSFDLVSLDPCVTVCDMASTPLENESLDVAVFCLSLMGTNFSDYLIEANRVLKPGLYYQRYFYHNQYCCMAEKQKIDRKGKSKDCAVVSASLLLEFVGFRPCSGLEHLQMFLKGNDEQENTSQAHLLQQNC